MTKTDSAEAADVSGAAPFPIPYPSFDLATGAEIDYALAAAEVGVFWCEIPQWRVTANGTLRRQFFATDDDDLSAEFLHQRMHPADIPMRGKALDEAARGRTIYDVEYRLLAPRGEVRWIRVRGRFTYSADGEPVRLDGITLDVTDRKSARKRAEPSQHREQIARRITAAIRTSTVPSQIEQIALDGLAHALGADRCVAIHFRPSDDLLHVETESRREDLPSFVGDYSLSGFAAVLPEIFPSSQILAVTDVKSESWSEQCVGALDSLRTRAMLDVPLLKDEQVVGLVSVSMADEPRNWTIAEIDMVASVTEQMREAADAAALLIHARESAAREALVSRIGDVLRRTLDPEEIKHNAVRMLGEALAADRCYFAIYDLDHTQVAIQQEWHRADLPDIKGVYAFPNTAEMFHELYHGKPTSVIVDRETAGLSPQTVENMMMLQLRSRASATVAGTNGMATFTVAMSDSPRQWTAGEVELIEKVGTQLRSAVEMARVQQREHRIAEDLQAALLPAVPDYVPGLAVSSYMLPALDEAAVGGDFADVYAIDKETYAVVIGDVSGKGLAAAAQIATVRNMLRGFMYELRTPREAVTSLNAVLTIHELLNGFVTAFVGLYDAGEGTITYVSCGHEPGLIRRAGGGDVEVMQCGGHPLGVAESVTYDEHVVRLGTDDMLVLYTDGLTESGPNRREMLGTEGFAHLVGELPSHMPPSEATRWLVNAAADYSKVPFRDDLCVVVMRRR